MWPDPSYGRSQRRWNSLEVKLAANNNDWLSLHGGGNIKEKKSYWKTTGRYKFKEQSGLENKKAEQAGSKCLQGTARPTAEKPFLVFFALFVPEIEIFCLRKHFGPGKSA